jgi:hypothetical protein
MFEAPEIKKPTMPLRRLAAVKASWKPTLLNLLLPGAGYWMIGQKTRARIIFCVWWVFLLLGFLQMKFGMVDGFRGGVYTPRTDPFEWLPTLGALATAGIGPKINSTNIIMPLTTLMSCFIKAIRQKVYLFKIYIKNKSRILKQI